MIQLRKLVLATTIALTMSATVANANVAKGQKLFIKKLKSDCEMTGAKMAGKHSQDEWESIYNAGKLAEEIKTICPKVKKVKEKFIPHYYDFFYEYANDSGNVPSC